MASLLVLIMSAILLGPLVGVFGVFRFFFPKNTLRIKEVFLFPIAFFLVILTDSYLIYSIIKLIPAEVSSITTFITWTFDFFHQKDYFEFLQMLLFLGLFFIPPIVFSFFLCWFLFHSWEVEISSERKKSTWYSSLFHVIKLVLFIRLLEIIAARFVKTHLLNHTGLITSFNKQNEILMLDVLSTDGYVYSGIYSDYAIEDTAVCNYSMRNIIRYKNTYAQTGKKIHTERYLLPNQGEIFFPVEKIQNFHFWKIKKNKHYKIDLEKNSKDLNPNDSAAVESSDNTMFAVWLMTVQWVSKVKFLITVYKPKDAKQTEKVIWKLIGLNVPPNEVQVRLIDKSKDE